MAELINTLTERLEQYMDDITDCCGDEVLYAELSARIEELHYVLKMLVDEEGEKDVTKMNKSSYKDLLKNYKRREKDV